MANEPVGSVEALLAVVPDGASWQDLPKELRTEFESCALRTLEVDRQEWGAAGLAEKERILERPTKAMIDNINLILSVKYATELPDGFDLSRDVKNPNLKRMAVRLYLAETSARGYMLLQHDNFKSWDGSPVKGVELLDHVHVADLAKFLTDTEMQLRSIPEEALTETEKLIRDKSYFTTRAKKNFTRPPVGRNGSFTFSSLYHLNDDIRPFGNDNELLDSYNASMFSEFREVNLGSIESFVFDFSAEFTGPWLADQGLPAPLVANVLKLAGLYRTRVLGHPLANSPFTLYSPDDRTKNWDAFTAEMISNADGAETMESYAATYAGTANRRAADMCVLALDVVEHLFPADSTHLNAAQRQQVVARINAETRPAAIITTIYAALDAATGATSASNFLKEAVNRQVTLGGYAENEPLRPEDKAIVLEMWEKVRAFITREYTGYPVDIAALIPEEPSILPGTEGCFSAGGEVIIGLKNQWGKASLYSTVMHEIKHAIDQRSKAAVEGAAWEGAASSVERQVWPLFIQEAMGDNPNDRLIAELLTAVDNVRFTATTDATLKIYLRRKDDSELNSFDFVKKIVEGYGYSDEAILNLRARRANASYQYLQYDYGLVMYSELLAYFQAAVGAAPRVDAYLLQACGMPSPKRNQASIDKLLAAIGSRH